jgi:hypothetical protein
MRKQEQKSEKRKRLFMSIFIVVIMSMSVLGYMIGRDSEDSIKYGKSRFFVVNGMYKTKIDNNDVYFNYNPYQAETFEVDGSIIEKIKNSAQLDTTSDVDSRYAEAIALAQFELVRELSLNNQFVRNGFTTENEFNLPIIVCAGATEIVPVLIFEQSNETSVSEEDNCIIIKGRSEQDFLILKDRILYGVFGII